MSSQKNEEAYQEYDTIITSPVNWVRNAGMEIREKKEESEMVRRLAEEEKLRKIRDKLKAEEKYLRERIELEKESIGAHKSWFLEDVEKNINVLRELSLEDSGIFIRIEEIGEDYLEGFGSIYQKTSHAINNFIKDLNQKTQDIRLEKEQVKEANQKLAEENMLIRDMKEKIDIYDNVNDRLSNMEPKCNVIIGNLTDSELLEKK